MAQNNNTNRNRKEDAARIMSTLIALRNTQDLAAKVEARTAEYNEFLMDTTTALIQAPTKTKEVITNQCFTAGHTRYSYSENGVYAALTGLDTLQRKMAESQDAANRMPALVDEYLGTIATVLGIDLTQNDIGPLRKYLADNGITNAHAQNEPAGTTEIGTTGGGDFDPVDKDTTEDPWDNCCNCPDKGNCEVCQACADYVDPEDMDTDEDNTEDEDEVQEEDDADEPRYVTGDQLSAILTDFAAAIPHLIPQPVPQPVQPIPVPAPPVPVMPALTPEEMAVLDTGDIDASENETVNIGDISETVSMLNDNQVATIDGDGIATVTGDINLNITFNGDVNIND